MDKSGDNGEEQPVVRKTRSGRTTVTPVKTKPTTRKTRKKMVLVEVDVSDEEEIPSNEIETSEKTIDDTLNQEKIDESLIHASDISITFNCDMEMTESFLMTDEANGEKNDEIDQLNDVAVEPIVSEPMEADEEMKEVEEVAGVNIEELENIPDDLPDVSLEEIEEIKSALEEMDYDDKKGEIDDVERSCSDAKEDLDELTGDGEDLKEVGEDMIGDSGELKEDVDDVKEKIEDVKEIVEDVKEIVEDVKEIVEDVKEKIEDVKEKVEDVKEIVEDVTEKPEDVVEAEPEDVEMEQVEDTAESDGLAEDSDGAKEEVADLKEEPKTAEKVVIQPADPDAENISEDELPGVQVAKVPETEEVSDEELPGPKRAELPADTEVVSEDELPAVKKEGTKRKVDEGDYDPGSPTSESEVSSKKPFLDPDIEKEKDKVEKPKKLPELDKYWKAVNDDPADFTGWTYLLQYVDQENDMEAAREAYDAFLSHYPYCYGYWRKYADYEKRKGNKKKCEEVFERGLRAIPLSVDLWIHYLTYVRTTKPDDEEFIRSQFERAVGACGLEFRSDRLWDSYVKWETDGKRPQNATALYDRLLATPTQGYTSHFDNFQEHVANNPPNKILEVDEFLALRKEVKHMLKHETTVEPADNADTPPGEDTQDVSTDEETKSIRERIISIRRKIHKNTTTAVTSRWNFEEGIKRPYFHVKPLERCQLKNWQEYLDYEIEQGDQTRIIVLFERCLIACALYEEFWLRFVHYLEGLSDPELHQKIKDVYERACTIHHIKKPTLHLQWAMFEESIKNFNKAAEILVNIEKSVPNMLQIAYRRINLERRREDNEKCSQLYEHYIANSKNKVVSTNLSIKFARFCLKVMNDVDKAYEALNAALTKEPNNSRIYLQLIDLTLHKGGIYEKEILGYIDAFLEKEGVELDQKVLFAQRKLEFLEDFGTDIQSVKTAYDEYQKYVKLNKEVKKKDVKSETVGKKEKNPPLPASQANAYGSYGNYANSSTPGAYQYSGSQQGQYNYAAQYGQGDQYQYGNWQYPQGTGYSGYNQWSGYGSGYGY